MKHLELCNGADSSWARASRDEDGEGEEEEKGTILAGRRRFNEKSEADGRREGAGGGMGRLFRRRLHFGGSVLLMQF